MPTGFTAEIEKGITFKQFATNCARAFGALVTMRDDPMDAPVPDEIKPDAYHYNKLKKAEKKLDLAKKMTLCEAKVLAKQEYEKRLRDNAETLKNRNALKDKYVKMLRQVENWQPPTPDHLNFKKFMTDQIVDSIKFDCSTDYYDNQVTLMSPKKYREEIIKSCEHDIKYHSEQHQKEVESCAVRTKWIQDLKKSLNVV